ncbi:MAG: glycoside hydrolase family 28 protein [Bacteroidota bacterium]|nr:glycoside hydrolase family 28 protein [Bacteroidota bacterium]
MSEPVFPNHRVSIIEHGAIADGRTLNTKAFADAINACVKSGGGTVVVPPGTWLTGPIKLESNINLHLERGALIQFSKRFEDFPLIAGLDGKSKKYIVTPPIYAFQATNIAITGEGVIDGAGEAWRYVKKEKLTASQWKELVSSGGVVTSDGRQWWPSKESMEGEKYIDELEKSDKEPTAADYAKAREYLRPDMVRLVQCNGILLDGPTFRNSPKFHIHSIQSEKIIVRNIKILTPWYAQNGDGLDLNSCRNVVVYKIMVDVGDDAICIKPGKIAKNQRPGPACENIVIADCEVYHGHGGFVIGSESYGGVNNISVRNCIFIGTDVGIRFKSARDRGGLVENIFIDGIQMRDIQNEAILFDMYYGDGSPEAQIAKGLDIKEHKPVTALTPRFQNISIKNIVSNGANRALLINGLPEMPIKNIIIDNFNSQSKKGILVSDGDYITMKNCNVTTEVGSVITLSQSRNIFLNKIQSPNNTEIFLSVDGEKSENIQIENVDLSNINKKIIFTNKAKETAIVRK